MTREGKELGVVISEDEEHGLVSRDFCLASTFTGRGFGFSFVLFSSSLGG